MKSITLLLIALVYTALSLSSYSYGQCTVYGNGQKPKGKIKSFSECCYSPKGNGGYSLNSKNSYIYNEDNNFLQKMQYSTSDSNIIEHTTTNTYVENKLTESNTDGVLIYSNGKPGNSGNNIKYIYNQNRNKIEERYFSDFGNKVTKFTYNDNGMLVKEIWDDPSNGYKSTKQYQYDIDGNLIQETMQMRDGSSVTNTVFKYKYDSKKNEIEENYYREGNHASKKTFKYDSKNNMTAQSCYYPDGRIVWQTTYKISYDKFNNWVSIISYSGNKISTITKREIEYH